MEIFKSFVANYGNLKSNNDLQIKEYLLNSWDKDEKVVDVSKNGYVSTASISRFVKKMRLASYKDYLRQKKFSKIHLESEREYEQVFKQVIHKKKNLLDSTLETVNEADLLKACQAINSASCVFITGTGYSRNQAEAMSMRLNRIGKRAIFVENIQELPFVNEQSYYENSTCIAISQTGDTSNVNAICEHFKNLNVTTIGICCTLKSDLNKLVDLTIMVPKIYSGMYLETIYSEVTVGAILDMIYSYALFETYEKSLYSYNKSVDLINGKK